MSDHPGETALTKAMSDLAELERAILTELVSSLANLSPSARMAAFALLQQTASRLGNSRTAVALSEPLLIREWSVAAGSTELQQLLAIDMTPGDVKVPKTRAATGRTLVSNGQLGADILHLPGGEGFAPHTHQGDHLLFVLGGQGTITVSGVITPTSAGQVYMIEGAVPHAVGAITDHVILAIGSPHYALGSEERQELTAYTAVLTDLGLLTCQICGIVAASGERLNELGCTHAPHHFD